MLDEETVEEMDLVADSEGGLLDGRPMERPEDTEPQEEPVVEEPKDPDLKVGAEVLAELVPQAHDGVVVEIEEVRMVSVRIRDDAGTVIRVPVSAVRVK